MIDGQGRAVGYVEEIKEIQKSLRKQWENKPIPAPNTPERARWDTWQQLELWLFGGSEEVNVRQSRGELTLGSLAEWRKAVLDKIKSMGEQNTSVERAKDTLARGASLPRYARETVTRLKVFASVLEDCGGRDNGRQVLLDKVRDVQQFLCDEVLEDPLFEDSSSQADLKDRWEKILNKENDNETRTKRAQRAITLYQIFGKLREEDEAAQYTALGRSLEEDMLRMGQALNLGKLSEQIANYGVNWQKLKQAQCFRKYPTVHINYGHE